MNRVSPPPGPSDEDGSLNHGAEGGPTRSHRGSDLTAAPRIIDRRTEMSRITEFLGQVAHRDGGLLLISGEAGVGKTRLLHEAESVAATGGMMVLSVDCAAQKRGVAFAPWVELIRQYVDSTPRDRVYRTARPHLGALTQLVPELEDRIWLYDPTTTKVELDRRGLLEAISHFWVALSEGRPLLISMDNLGRTDSGSLELLENVVRNCREFPLGVVGTYRDTHAEENKAFQHFLLSLEGQKRRASSALAPFDREQLGAFIGAILGQTEVPAEVRDVIFAKTRGNPLYAMELLRWLVDQCRLDPRSAGWTWPSVSQITLPVAVERAIEARLGGLEGGSRLANPPPRRIAVLPFANLSPDPNDGYFSDGLTEELISVISQLGGLQVIARTSVMTYKSTSKGVAQIGAELGVSSILEGTVRKAGSRLRITVQLIDVSSQAHLWSGILDRVLDDVFAVQTEIAQKVAETLEIELRGAEQARLQARPKVRSDSYLAYLKGRTLLEGRAPAALGGAKAEFERAIALDPENAAAYSGLADTSILLGAYAGMAWDDALDSARTWATRAVEIDPNLSEAHASLGLVNEYLFRYDDSEREFVRALSLNPGSASTRHWYAEVLWDLDRPDDALREQLQAQELDPLCLVNYASPAYLLMYLGRYEEARDLIDKAGELEGYGTVYHDLEICFHLLRSEFALASQHLDQNRESKSRDPPIAGAYAELYALTGQRDKANEFLERLKAVPGTRFGKAETIALVECCLGNLDECFRWLDQAVKDHALQLRRFRTHPWAKPIREDPRFQELLRGIGLA